MIACCLGVKWIKTCEVWEEKGRGRGRTRENGEEYDFSFNRNGGEMRNEMKVGKLAFILEGTKDHFVLFPWNV